MCNTRKGTNGKRNQVETGEKRIHSFRSEGGRKGMFQSAGASEGSTLVKKTATALKKRPKRKDLGKCGQQGH